MKIQIHSSINNMSTTGRQVLGDMQDTYTPLVDLLIRESIQNSTDAARSVLGDKVRWCYKLLLGGSVRWVSL